MDSLRETVALAVALTACMLACFPLCLHLDNGLMQPDERLFRFPCLLHVPLNLSHAELSPCCLVLLVELDLSALQDLADALSVGCRDRCCRGVSSRMA